MVPSFLVCSARSTSMGCLPALEQASDYQPSYSKPFELCCTLPSNAASLSYTAYCWAYATAPYWATLHPPELHWILFWAMLYHASYTAPSEQRRTPLGCAAFYWAPYCAIPYHTILSYTAPCWATLHPDELHPSLMLNPAELPPPPLPLPAPYGAMLQTSELCCTFWSMLHLTEPQGTLLNYAAAYWPMLYPLSFAEPYWATVPAAELRGTPYGLACHNWATLLLLSYAVPYWAVQHLLSYAAL